MRMVSTRAAATQLENRTLHRRVIATATLALVHLVWLIVDGPGNWFVAIVFFGLEAWGIAQFGLRAMLAWGSTQPARAVTGAVEFPVDIVITCTFQSADELERTLISCRSVRHARRIVVTTQQERPDLHRVLAGFDVDVLIVPGNHVDGFWAGAQQSRLALWLEAGQVPMPNAIEVLAPEFADASVAYVQTGLGQLNTDSFAHIRGGRDEDAFRRDVVQPRLGERGSASWLGGGSMVRVLAVASSGGVDPGDQAALQRSMVRLQAGGWACRYHPGPELIHAAAPDSLGAYLMKRRRAAIESLRVFTTPENPVRHVGLTRRQRLEHVALASGFASSLRQFVLVVLLIVVLLTGAVPYGGTGVVWAMLWVPLQLLVAGTNRRMARGTMERGDWTRQAWRTLTADINAFATVLGIRRRVIHFHSTTGSGLGALAKLGLPAATLVALDVAVVARGLTLLWPRLLPRFSLSGRLVALALGVTAIVVLVDVLQMAVRRKQRRTSFRLATDLPAVIDGHPARVVDLAVKGLGSKIELSTSPFSIDQSVVVSLRLPTTNGGATTLQIGGTVRSLVNLGGAQRVGIQFHDLDSANRATLISYCAVGHHAVADADATVHDVDPSQFEVPATRGTATKLLSAVAMLLGVVVLFAGPAAPAAFADVATTSSVCLHTSTGSPVPGAQAAFEYDGVWQSIGTTGESGCVEGQMPGVKTKVELVHQDIRQVIRQHLGNEPTVQFATVPVRIELADASGEPLPGGAVQFRSAGTWKPIGATGADGRLTVELLASRRPFSMTLDGVRVEKTVDLREVASVPFTTEAYEVTLHDSDGRPVSDAIVEYRGDDWTQLGTTMDDGTFRAEMLPGRVRFAVQTGGGRTTLRQDLADDPTVRFATNKTVVEFVDSVGAAIPDARVEIQSSGQWMELGHTDSAGQIATELLPESRSFRVSHAGRRLRVRQDIAEDPTVRFATVRSAVIVRSPDGSPLADVEVETHGEGWAGFGTTDVAGRAEAELLPVRTRFRLSYGGHRMQVQQDLATEPTVAVSTTEAIVRLVDSTGSPIAGSRVDIKTGRWILMGTTDANGEVRREMLPTGASIRVLHDGLRKLVRWNVSDTPMQQIQTVPLIADAAASVDEYRAGSWRPFIDGVEVLPVRVQVRMADGSRHTVTAAEGAVTFVPSGATEPLASPDAVGEQTGSTVDGPDSASTTSTMLDATTTTVDADDNAPDDRGLAAVAPTTTGSLEAPFESTTTVPPIASTTTTDAAAPTSIEATTTTETTSTTTDAGSSTTSSAPESSITTTSAPEAPVATTTIEPAGTTVVTPTTVEETTTTTAPEAESATTSAPTTTAPTEASTTSSAAAAPTTTTTVVPTTTEQIEATTEPADPSTTAAPAEASDLISTGDDSAPAEEELFQAVAGGVVLAAADAVFPSEAMTTFAWSSPDAVATEVLAVTLEDAAVYSQAGSATTVGYEFLIDNASDVDLARGSVIELHIPDAMELTPESQDEWDCDAQGTTWRCRHVGPFLADSSSTIRVAAAIPAPDVIAVASGSRTADFGILAAAAALMLCVLYAGLSLAGSGSQRRP